MHTLQMDPTFGCLLNLCMIALEKINCIVSHYSKGGCKQLKNKKENEARLLLFKKKKQQQYKRNTFKVLKQVTPAIDLSTKKFLKIFLLFQNTVYVARIHISSLSLQIYWSH